MAPRRHWLNSIALIPEIRYRYTYTRDFASARTSKAEESTGFCPRRCVCCRELLPPIFLDDEALGKRKRRARLCMGKKQCTPMMCADALVFQSSRVPGYAMPSTSLPPLETHVCTTARVCYFSSFLFSVTFEAAAASPCRPPGSRVPEVLDETCGAKVHRRLRTTRPRIPGWKTHQLQAHTRPARALSSFPQTVSFPTCPTFSPPDVIEGCSERCTSSGRSPPMPLPSRRPTAWPTPWWASPSSTRPVYTYCR